MEDHGISDDDDDDDAELAAGLFAMLGASNKELETVQQPAENVVAAETVPVAEEEEDDEEEEEEEEEPEHDNWSDQPCGNDGVEKTQGEAVDDDGDDALFTVDVEGGTDVIAGVDANAETLIAVPAEVAEHLLCDDAEGLNRLAVSCGARLAFLEAAAASGRVRGKPARMLRADGAPEAVAAVKRTLRNLVATSAVGRGRGNRRRVASATAEDRAGGAAGSAGASKGICKWFAAGFCRFGGKTIGGCCRNGAHDGAAAIAAQAAWRDSCSTPSSSSSAGATPQPRATKLPVLLLLDLEGGGNAEGRDGEDEIIEVPVLAMCSVTGDELGRFHRFARPGCWDRERASMSSRFAESCFNTSSSAIPFPQVMAELRAWIGALLAKAAPLPPHAQPSTPYSPEDFLFVTCGNWDVKTVMPRQCNKPSPGTVDFATQRLLLSRWCNMKEIFQQHFKLSDAAAPTGMRGMLKRLELPLSGQHHLGMDDVSNLSAVLRLLVLQGAAITATGYADTSVPSTPPDIVDGKRNAAHSSISPLQPPQKVAKTVNSSSNCLGAGPAVAKLADAFADYQVVEAAPAQPRSGRSILQKYSNTARAEALGQDFRIKKKPPKAESSAVATGGGAGAIGVSDVVRYGPHWLRGSPSLFSSGKGKGKRR